MSISFRDRSTKYEGREMQAHLKYMIYDVFIVLLNLQVQICQQVMTVNKILNYRLPCGEGAVTNVTVENFPRI